MIRDVTSKCKCRQNLEIERTATHRVGHFGRTRTLAWLRDAIASITIKVRLNIVSRVNGSQWLGIMGTVRGTCTTVRRRTGCGSIGQFHVVFCKLRFLQQHFSLRCRHCMATFNSFTDWWMIESWSSLQFHHIPFTVFASTAIQFTLDQFHQSWNKFFYTIITYTQINYTLHIWYWKAETYVWKYTIWCDNNIFKVCSKAGTVSLMHCAITNKIMGETKDKKKSQKYEKQSENHGVLK